MYKKILLATDGTPSSDKAENHALQLVANTNSELIIIHILNDNLCHYGEVDTLAPLEARESFIDYVIEEQKESSKEIEETIAQKSKSYQSHFEFKLQQGEPVDAIASIANKEDFDLLIVGGQRNKKKRGFRSLSFSDRLSNQTDKPIITVI